MKILFQIKVFSYNRIFHTQFAKQNKRHQQQYFFAKTLSSVFDFFFEESPDLLGFFIEKSVADELGKNCVAF